MEPFPCYNPLAPQLQGGMNLLETLNYFIRDQEGHLQCCEWDIREETNQENPDLDWYCEQYDLCKQRLDDLRQIKSIVEGRP